MSDISDSKGGFDDRYGQLLDAEQEAVCQDIDLVIPLVKELTAYQAQVFLILCDGRQTDEADALATIAKHQKLIEDRERRRFEPLATTRAIIEAEARNRALGRVARDFLIPGNEEKAREIIKRISDAAIELAFVRHDLTSAEFDEESYPEATDGVEAVKAFVEEIKQDTLNCLSGDDFGCLDPEDLDETNCERLWLEKVLADTIPRPVFDAHTKAVGAFLSEMAEIYSLDGCFGPGTNYD